MMGKITKKKIQSKTKLIYSALFCWYVRWELLMYMKYIIFLTINNQYFINYYYGFAI